MNVSLEVLALILTPIFTGIGVGGKMLWAAYLRSNDARIEDLKQTLPIMQQTAAALEAVKEGQEGMKVGLADLTQHIRQKG